MIFFKHTRALQELLFGRVELSADAGAVAGQTFSYEPSSGS